MMATEKPSTTPILDLRVPLPKAYADGFNLRTYFPFVTAFVVLVCIGNYEVLLLPFGFLLTTYVVTTIHELGHIIAGLSVGLRFQSVAIGPLWIKHESGALKLKPRHNIIGGLTYMSLDRIR